MEDSRGSVDNGELGPGFAFVGRHVHFEVDGDDFFFDPPHAMAALRRQSGHRVWTSAGSALRDDLGECSSGQGRLELRCRERIRVRRHIECRLRARPSRDVQPVEE